MSSPRFSVLIPVFNRPDCIRETIDSVLAQTFTDYEVIVINDGSTDGTQEILDSYGSKIRVMCQSQQGPEVARNRAAAQAGGEYLAFLDSDDLFLPCALATYDRVIRAFGSPALVIGSMKYFATGQPLPTNPPGEATIEVLKYRDFLSKDIGIGISSSRIVLKKSVFEQAGGLRNSTPTTFHVDDYNLLLRTGTFGPCAVVCHPTTVAYREHATNTIRNLRAMARGVLAIIRAEYQGSYPGGPARRFDRYAIIGGPTQQWTRRALRGGQIVLGLKLLLTGAPMIAASVFKKLRLKTRPPMRPLVLPVEAEIGVPAHSL
jgi:glycosyltransferase involved in cell wall biosynthesis